MAEFSSTSIVGVNFELTTRYHEPLPVELDAFGLICSAKDRILKKVVAIKKLTRPFGSATLAKQAFREIIGLSDVFISPKEDLYIVTELMWTNLQQLIAKGPVHDDFAKYFTYQVLRGLKYVHSAGIIHRDLKPSSLLINENCDLRICNFGHARLQDRQMTGYVATRYYRAPEVMLNWQEYTEKVDIWSTACILAEMLRGKPLFPATSHTEQFNLFVQLLGNPSERTVEKIKNKNTRGFVQNLPQCKREPFKEVFPEINSSVSDLLERMLLFDVDDRISTEKALAHPYMAPYHDPTDEPVVESKFDWRFDNADVSISAWKAAVFKEVLLFRQFSTQARYQTTIRNAILKATHGHPTPEDETPRHVAPDNLTPGNATHSVAAFPITEIEHFPPSDTENFLDDDYSSFINDFN
ncbi:mitogen-activated protein kinase Hog1 [Penicillium angulare]|uniref:mitogen-activated protein kinase n=1 Tax=Penicillium angulare TaxID=116970 RepID=A0A9W9KS86_9EURO|nr:mitogen-activated protein kinase Hog1 [Penicillium angulare]